jgi:hypothetical protein
MWSFTSPNAERISDPKKFGSSTKKDFFNSICHERTSVMGPTLELARSGHTPEANHSD